MNINNVLGIIFSNSYDSALPELTGVRTMGSVPFGGRYRLIDFALSNMVNSGISKVGVITKSNYRSLMDHIGAGKAWDLARKRDGLFLLPPFSAAGTEGFFRNRFEALRGNLDFITRSKEEFVVLCDSHVVCNLDFNDILNAHIENDADITIGYTTGIAPDLEDLTALTMDDTGRITGTSLCRCGENVSYSLHIYVIRKALLERLINEGISSPVPVDLERDLIRGNVNNLKLFGFACEGFVRSLDSLQTYYDVSMELLNLENRNALFNPKRPIYTKLRDDMPAIYSPGCRVNGSLVAEGCKIEGEVENSILFHRVTIAKGAVIKNSIIMQDTYVGENVNLDCVITDKRVVIKPDKTLSGAPNFPLFIGRGIVI